jgi:menaquinol-cytochrome c reductase iron-sulfur subunit
MSKQTTAGASGAGTAKAGEADHAHSGPSLEERRGFLGASIAAGAVGAVITAVPLGAGALVLLDPVRRRMAQGNEGGKTYLRVATVESLPENIPVQVPVIADLTDAWNREANQPIGAVYLIRQGDGVQCFNAICPHAGCFVSFAADRKVFQCPCHTSAFNLDGSIIAPSPSPRDMDQLDVDADKLKQGEVWVRFVNYLPGKHDQVEK